MKERGWTNVYAIDFGEFWTGVALNRGDGRDGTIKSDSDISGYAPLY